MNEKQIRELINQLKKQFKAKYSNRSNEEIEQMILDVFFRAYCENKMSREDLTTLTEFMGYEVKDEILDEIDRKKEGEQYARTKMSTLSKNIHHRPRRLCITIITS